VRGHVTVVWQGLGPTVVSLAPFVAINFAAYDTLKAHLFPSGGGVAQGPAYSLAMGATAGIIAQTACYPLGPTQHNPNTLTHPHTLTYT
jgi:solute carrier family 25 phosphate transporter 23/24/25/41